MSTNTGIRRHTNSLKQEGQRLAGQATTSRLVETLMRLGFFVRGLIYGVVGVLSFQVAIGGGGTLDDPQGAIVVMGKTPVGNVVLYAILVGLIGYSLWGEVRAIFDPLHKGSDLKGIAQRIGYGVSAGSYALLALATYRLISGVASAARNGAQATQNQQTTASILSNSWGPWVVAIAAVILMAVGLAQIVHGQGRNFERQFQIYALSSTQQTWIDRLSRFGTAARGVVFTMIGLFLFLAAYHNDPRQAITSTLWPMAPGHRRAGANCLRNLFGHERSLAAVQKIGRQRECPTLTARQ